MRLILDCIKRRMTKERVRFFKCEVKRQRLTTCEDVDLIAARTGLSRAALSLYASGARAANFPPPTARVTSDSPLWDWCLVSEWMYAHHKVDQEVVTRARLMKEANRIVEMGNIKPNHFAQQMRSRAVAFESA